MKNLTLLSLMGGSLLLMQSCSKKEVILPAKDLNSAKQTTGLPAGFMTGVLPSGTYKFISYVSTIDPAINKSIGVTGGSTASGALIEQRDFAGTAQEWRITQTGYGTYSVINYNSGMALDNTGHALVDNNPIEQWPFTIGHTAESWVIEYQGLNVYRIKCYDNLNMGVHVKDGSTANGANIVLKTFAGGTTQPWGYFYAYAMPISSAPITIHTPPDTLHNDNYPRVTLLPNGNLLASFDYGSTNVFDANITAKIYRSTNNGTSWSYVTDITDTHRGLGLHEPNPFVIPTTIGSVSAGTIICGVRSNVFGADYIDVYRSNDNGTTWAYMSNVATGIDFDHNIFEPFFLVDSSGRLICYYSDCRDPAHSQKLVYQVSTDNGLTWGATVTDVVAVPLQSDRPGMFRASKMGNGKWIMDYEDWDPSSVGIYYKTSTDGVNWDSTPSNRGTRVASVDGAIPKGTPGILWTPAGSTLGTVIVTGGQQNTATSGGTDNFVNFNYGIGNWYRVPQPLPYDPAIAGAGYSRMVGMSADGKTLFHINKVNNTSKNDKIQFVATPAW